MMNNAHPSTQRLQQLNRMYRTISRCNHHMIRAEGEQTLAQDFCSVMVEEGSYRMAWVGYAENDEARSIRPIAYAGLESGYLENLNLTWADTDRGSGPGARCIREQTIQVTRDIANDPRFVLWREEAAKRGYASSIALPLKIGTGTIGFLGIYSERIDAFEEEEIGVLTEAADDLAYGITALRNNRERKELADAVEEAARFNRATLDGLSAHIAILDEDGAIIAVNKPWEDFASANGLASGTASIGANYLAVCDRSAGPYSEEGTVVAVGIRAVLGGVIPQFALEYPCHSPSEQRWFIVRVTPFPGQERRRAIVAHENITELKRSEEAVFQSEQKLRLFFEYAPAALAMFDDQLRYLAVSRRWRQDFGLSSEEALVGRSHFDVSPDLPERWKLAYGRALEGEVVQVEEDRFVVPNGHEQWLRWEVRPWYRGEGAIGGVVIFSEDITERKQAEATLRQQALLVKSISDAVITTDLDFVIQSWNSAAEALYGWRAAEVIGHRLSELIPTRYPAEVPEAVLREFQAQGWWQGEAIQQHRAGHDLFVLSSVTLVRDEAGQPRSVLGINRDITARRQAEAALRDMAENMAAAQRIAHVGSWEIQLNEDLEPVDPQLWSDECYRIFGLEPGSTPMTSALFYRHVHPDDRQRAGQALLQAIQAGGEADYDYRLIRPDGSLRYLHDQVKVILDEAGDRPVKVIGLVRDITERKEAEAAQAKLEEQLRQAQKMESVGRLAGGVAHDFNNLLTVIQGYAELMHSRMAPGDVALRRSAEQIIHAAHSATSLTRQLLAFSRKQILAPVILDLNELVSNLQKMLQRLIGEDILLEISLAPELYPLLADPGQLEQVLLNLAVNARDAMPTGGHLTIETANVNLDGLYRRTHPEAPLGPAVLLAVTDTGHGMDKKTQVHIFEPFFTTQGLGHGTGLGLATVHGIVKQSGGDIQVYSEPGQGTTFKIYLPAATIAPTPVSPEPSQTEEILGGSETILLAEDDDFVRELILTVLEKAGYTVLAARRGDEALALAQTHPEPIHLLLTDVVMPEMSGRLLAEQLTAQRPGLKVLYMSGYTDDAVVRHGLLTAEVEFLSKPFSPIALAGKVRQVLDK